MPTEENINMEELEKLLDANRQIDAAIKKLDASKKKITENMLALMGKTRNVSVKNFSLYVSQRDSFKVKEDVTLLSVAQNYPQAVKIDAKTLYEVAENPLNFVDVIKGNPFLTIREKKAVDGE